MWGNIFLEASTQQNFNFGFSSSKSDILIHLSQWQYWWWFWFSLVWVAYYYIIVYSITKRSFNFNPVINTSLRGHGKWGDFLVALIPLSWCGNILVNSNFILRMIEWQNESSLFTLRIQGKQWYWVYKYDASASTAIEAAPKNIGHNRWFSRFKNETYVADSYYQAIHLAAQLEYQSGHTVLREKNSLEKDTLDKVSLTSNGIVNAYSLTTPVIKNNLDTTSSHLSKTNPEVLSDSTTVILPSSELAPRDLPEEIASNLTETQQPGTITSEIQKNFSNMRIANFNGEYPLPQAHDPLKEAALNDGGPRKPQQTMHFDYIRLDDHSDVSGNLRWNTSSAPIRLVPGIINNHVEDQITSGTELTTTLLFNWKFSQTNDTLVDKTTQSETLWGFRQKKYKRLKKFLFAPRRSFDPVTFESTTLAKTIGGQRLVSNKIISEVEAAQTYKDPVIKESLVLSKKIKTIGLDPTYNEEDYESQIIPAAGLKLLSSETNTFDYYKAIKNNKHRSDLLSITLARRLLRTKRTLVLPAHVNITVITNSYDVVHSWFIPGLGIKLDCVPGRSTHHTFYVDNVGFYYGQCAEICGRYHHHMPIRVCALPFEHFLVWWQKKGLPRLNRINNQGTAGQTKYYNSMRDSKNITKNQSTKYKYTW